MRVIRPPSIRTGNHNLVQKLGALTDYRGFLFGSVNPDVEPLGLPPETTRLST